MLRLANWPRKSGSSLTASEILHEYVEAHPDDDKEAGLDNDGALFVRLLEIGRPTCNWSEVA